MTPVAIFGYNYDTHFDVRLPQFILLTQGHTNKTNSTITNSQYRYTEKFEIVVMV